MFSLRPLNRLAAGLGVRLLAGFASEASGPEPTTGGNPKVEAPTLSAQPRPGDSVQVPHPAF